MGEFAVIALSIEQGITFSDAEEILYPAQSRTLTRCPICNKRHRSRKAVRMHCDAVHTKPQHQERIATWALQAEATP